MHPSDKDAVNSSHHCQFVWGHSTRSVIASTSNSCSVSTQSHICMIHILFTIWKWWLGKRNKIIGTAVNAVCHRFNSAGLSCLLNDWGNVVWFLAGAREFPDQLYSPCSLLRISYQGGFQWGVKQPWHYIDHLPSGTARNRNGCNCNSTHLRLPGMHRDTFILSVNVPLQF